MPKMNIPLPSPTYPIPRGVIPPWAGFVTAFVDLLADRFEWSATAWGPGPTSVVIDHGTIWAPPNVNDGWRDVRKIFAAEWPSAHLRPQIAVKYGIAPVGHNTQRAYSFSINDPSVLCIKGVSGQIAHDTPLIHPSALGGKLKTDAGGFTRVPLWSVNTRLVNQISVRTLVCEADLAKTSYALVGYNYAMAGHYGIESMSDADWHALFARESNQTTQSKAPPHNA